MTSLANLHDQIAVLFSEKLNLDVPSSDTDLFEIGLLDSLSFVDLLLCLEQKFGTKVSIEDLEIDNYRSIEKIAEFVISRDLFKERV